MINIVIVDHFLLDLSSIYLYLHIYAEDILLYFILFKYVKLMLSD